MSNIINNTSECIDIQLLTQISGVLIPISIPQGLFQNVQIGDSPSIDIQTTV